MTSAQMSAADLARATGKSGGAVTQWLDGTIKSIKGDTAAKIQDATGFNASWLSTGKGPKHPPTLPAVYQPNEPIPLAGRAGGAVTLEAAIDALRGHIRASGANKDAVAALLAAVGKDPDDERAAQALHLMLDTAFAQAGAKVA